MQNIKQALQSTFKFCLYSAAGLFLVILILIAILSSYGPVTLPFSGKITIQTQHLTNNTRYYLGFHNIEIKWMPNAPGIFISLPKAQIHQYYKDSESQKWLKIDDIMLPENWGIGANLRNLFQNKNLLSLYVRNYKQTIAMSEQSSHSSADILKIMNMKMSFDVLIQNSEITLVHSDQISVCNIASLKVFNNKRRNTKNVKVNATLLSSATNSATSPIKIDAVISQQNEDDTTIDIHTNAISFNLLHNFIHSSPLHGKASYDIHLLADSSSQIQNITANAIGDIRLQQHNMQQPVEFDRISFEASCKNNCTTLLFDKIYAIEKAHNITIQGNGKYEQNQTELFLATPDMISEKFVYDKITQYTTTSLNQWLCDNLQSQVLGAHLKMNHVDNAFHLDLSLSNTTLVVNHFTFHIPQAKLSIHDALISVQAPDGIAKIHDKHLLSHFEHVNASINTENALLTVDGNITDDINAIKQGLSYLTDKKDRQIFDHFQDGKMHGHLYLKIPLSTPNNISFHAQGNIAEMRAEKFPLLNHKYDAVLPNVKFDVTEKTIDFSGEIQTQDIVIDHAHYHIDYDSLKSTAINAYFKINHKILQEMLHIKQNLWQGEAYARIHLAQNTSDTIKFTGSLDMQKSTVDVANIALHKEMLVPAIVKFEGSSIGNTIKIDNYSISSEQIQSSGNAKINLKNLSYTVKLDAAKWNGNNLSANISKDDSALNIKVAAKTLNHTPNTQSTEDTLSISKLDTVAQRNINLTINADEVLIANQKSLENLYFNFQYADNRISEAFLDANIYNNQISSGYITSFYDQNTFAFVTNNISDLLQILGYSINSASGGLDVKMRCSQEECDGNILLSSFRLKESLPAINILKIISLSSLYGGMSSMLQGNSGLLINSCLCKARFSHVNDKTVYLDACRIKSPIFYSKTSGYYNFSKNTLQFEGVLSPMDIFRSVGIMLKQMFPKVEDDILSNTKERSNFIITKQEGSALQVKTKVPAIIIPGLNSVLPAEQSTSPKPETTQYYSPLQNQSRT